MSTKIYVQFMRNGIRPDEHLTSEPYKGPMKQASPETKSARRQEAKYTGRRNMCDVCFVAVSATGDCCCTVQ